MNNAKPGDVVTLNGKAYEATQIEDSENTCYGCTAFAGGLTCLDLMKQKPCDVRVDDEPTEMVIWKDQEQLRECRKAQAFCDGLLHLGEEEAIKYTMNHLTEREWQAAEQTHQECETAQSYFELLVQSGFTDEWATYLVMLWLAEKEFTKG